MAIWNSFFNISITYASIIDVRELKIVVEKSPMFMILTSCTHRPDIIYQTNTSLRVDKIIYWRQFVLPVNQPTPRRKHAERRSLTISANSNTN